MSRYFILFTIVWFSISTVHAENDKPSCPPDFVGVRVLQRDKDTIIEAVAKVEAHNEDMDSLKLTEAESRLESKALLKMYMDYLGIPFEGGGIVSKVLCRYGLDVFASSVFDPQNRERANKLRSDLQNSKNNSGE
jgi:hypothetical protein